ACHASNDELNDATRSNERLRSRRRRLRGHDQRCIVTGAPGSWRVTRRIASRSGSLSGGGRNSAASITLNTDVVAAIPSAIDSTATAVTTGVRRRLRQAKRVSLRKDSSMFYSGRRRIAPLYVRTETLEPPLPSVSRNEFGVDAAGRTRVNPFWM